MVLAYGPWIPYFRWRRTDDVLACFSQILAPEHRMTSAGHAMQRPLSKLSKVRPHQIDPLTTRERQIIGVIGEALTNKEIARRLRLAEGTVKVHLHRIYRKLGV